MKTQQIKLTDEEIKEQEKQANKYKELIEKELSFDDLADWDNIYSYWECYQHSINLINNPVIEMPVFE